MYLVPDSIPQQQTGSVLHLSDLSASHRGPSPAPDVPDISVSAVKNSLAPVPVSTSHRDLLHPISHLLPQSAWRSSDKLEDSQQGLSGQHQFSVPGLQGHLSLSDRDTSDLTHQRGSDSDHEKIDSCRILQQWNQTPGYQPDLAPNPTAYFPVPDI